MVDEKQLMTSRLSDVSVNFLSYTLLQLQIPTVHYLMSFIHCSFNCLSGFPQYRLPSVVPFNTHTYCKLPSIFSKQNQQ